jgi:hypothetical protein
MTNELIAQCKAEAAQPGQSLEKTINHFAELAGVTPQRMWEAIQ